MAFNTIIIVCFYFFKFITNVNSVPPERCFAKFRWDDCGKPPTPVIYYYKSGSRCEVGMWRGCYPNYNMFENEYECVATCIFTMRAMPADYHELLSNQIEMEEETTTLDYDMTTDGNDTMTNTTDTADTGATDGGEGEATDGGEATGDGAGGEGETGGDGEATTAGEEAATEAEAAPEGRK